MIPTYKEQEEMIPTHKEQEDKDTNKLQED